MSADQGSFRYEDLFDLENRPGAGVRLWGKAVEEQIDRVLAHSNNLRQQHAPDWLTVPDDERLDTDPEAERRLHTEVYFLALAIRRVLLFHAAIKKQVNDPRLEAAEKSFLAIAREAKAFRDFFEHLDEYLLGTGKAQEGGRIAGRISPILMLRFGEANVTVAFGDERLDITLAGQAAALLARTTGEVWEAYLDRSKPSGLDDPPNDGVRRMFEVTTATSIVVGGADEGHQVILGTLLRTNVRPASPGEVDESKPPSAE